MFKEVSKEELLLISVFTVLGTSFWVLLLEFFSGVYVLNLMTLSINGAILYLLFLFAPVLLKYWRIRSFLELNRGLVFIVGTLGFLSYYFSNAFVKVFFLGLGFAGVFTGFIIYWRDEKKIRNIALNGLLIGLIVSLLLKYAWFSRSIVWLSWFSVLVFMLLISAASYYLQSIRGGVLLSDYEVIKKEWWITGIGFGVLLFFTHWLFSSYGVIPRWSSLDPEKTGIFVVTGLIIGFIFKDNELFQSVYAWLIFFIGGILLSYENGFSAFMGGLLMSLVLPGLWTAIIQRFKGFDLGRSTSLGVIIYVLLSMFSIFTVVYDYVPGGYLFKEREEIILIVSSLLLLTIFLRVKDVFIFKFNRKTISKSALWGLIIWLVILLPIVFSGRSLLVEPTSASAHGPIIALQYNIQQGFDSKGIVNFRGVAKIIRSTGATIVGLEETETMRISAGNRDVAAWLGETLKMNVFEGPRPKDSTFGNALLTVYPILSAKAEILPSHGELAVLIVARLLINSTVVNVLVAHFGEYFDDRLAQAKKTAEIINSLTGPIILLGDFNSVPGSEQINEIMKTGVNNTYLVLNGNNQVPTTLDGSKMIDMIFYKGLTATRCEVLTWAEASDHYPVIGVSSL